MHRIEYVSKMITKLARFEQNLFMVIFSQFNVARMPIEKSYFYLQFRKPIVTNIQHIFDKKINLKSNYI